MWIFLSFVSVSFKPSILFNFVKYCYLFPNKSKIFAANLLNTGEGNKYQSKKLTPRFVDLKMRTLIFNNKKS